MPAEPFLIRNYQVFSELPFDRLHALDYAVYIIDYDWKYLFLNQSAGAAVGKSAQDLVGKNAREEVFSAVQYQPVFYQISHSVKTKTTLDTELYSPLRDQKVKLYGHGLADCYFFWAVPLPGKNELIYELRMFLKKFSWDR